MSALHLMARIAAERMLNSVIAGLLLTLMAWVLVRLVPGTNARTRVAIWFSALMLLPGLSLISVFAESGSTVFPLSTARLVVPEFWAFAGLILWALMAGIAVLRVLSGISRIRQMRAACVPIDVSTLEGSVAALIKQFRPDRSLLLLQSRTARVPMAVGFFRPAVIVPEWALNELPPAELAAVFLHEFAHLRRWDDWTNFFQKVIRALFFFHPGLWWLDRQLALDREIACDDMVLEATNNAHDYAHCLLDLAEKSLLRRSFALAHAAVHHVQHMALRIGQILDTGRPCTTRVSKVVLCTMTVLAGVCVVALLQSPTVISFQRSMPPVAKSPGPVATPAIDRANRSAQVIPAMIRERSSSPQPTTRKRNLLASAVKPHQDLDMKAAKFVAGKQQPSVLRAGLHSEVPAMMPVESMLLVMHDGSLDSNGRMIWTFSVWRITVFHPVEAPVRGTTASNSI